MKSYRQLQIERATVRYSARLNTLIAVAVVTVALMAILTANLNHPVVAWCCLIGATAVALWISISTIDIKKPFAIIEKLILSLTGVLILGVTAIIRSANLLVVSTTTVALLLFVITNIENEIVAMCCVCTAVLYAIWSGVATFVYAQTCPRIESWVRTNMPFPLVLSASILILLNTCLVIATIWTPLLLPLFPIISIFSPVVIGWLTAFLIWTYEPHLEISKQSEIQI